jgi:pimeloyl-ACP methyl ester carboxylesterase
MRLCAIAGVLCASLLAGAQGLEVNGHRLFLNCEGASPGPTVILIAGAGGSTATWDKIQPQISRFAKVCSYDRAGLGRSDPVSSAQPQSATQIVNDLSVLLRVGHVKSPYVLVGHSIGGIYARMFDQLHDSEVAGIILLARRTDLAVCQKRARCAKRTATMEKPERHECSRVSAS